MTITFDNIDHMLVEDRMLLLDMPINNTQEILENVRLAFHQQMVEEIDYMLNARQEAIDRAEYEA